MTTQTQDKGLLIIIFMAIGLSAVVITLVSTGFWPIAAIIASLTAGLWSGLYLLTTR